jgi:hypothetical protein
MLGRPDTVNDATAAHLVFQCRKPSVEFSGAVKSALAVDCIRVDTLNAIMASSPYRSLRRVFTNEVHRPRQKRAHKRGQHRFSLIRC